ncbi:helix-turn-helix transcriptional regulator [Gelidibacter japonicus]|uniref:helix-turn-helix domain-containing protein n=1 Tax=Gelidibacter japonicus TaxID=1962232 RepID=UPI002AFFC2E9|nr:helix-turn-helix transcriptional regulator [Gelidibacter japonicus]
MKNYVSINFVYVRERNYLNRKEFATKHGISYGALSSYEQAVSLPSIDFVREICLEYKISIDDFVNTDLSKKSSIESNKKANEESGQKLSEKEVALYNKIIDSKDAQISSLEQRIAELKRQTTILETLLNQNGII